MTESEPGKDRYRLRRLSCGHSKGTWAIAVFAHNEAKRIGAALKSIIAAADGQVVEVYVLANGCTDSTSEQVSACAGFLDNLWLLETQVGDKANAWNLFVHEVLATREGPPFETVFFMDGDVTLEPGSMPLLASALVEIPSAHAAGGMPATGRDRDPWRQRMVQNAMLAGNYYALRGSFIGCLQEREVRIPLGLIGEDFLVSWLVSNDDWCGDSPVVDGPRCVFHTDALFAFRSLSPWSPTDIRTYLRRKWRYTLRAVQHQMLMMILTHQGVSAMPRDVEMLYRLGPMPSRLQLADRNPLLRLVAVQWIRSKAASGQGAQRQKLRTL